MDLLNQIIRQPVDPDYAVVAARSTPPPPLRWGLVLVGVVVGALFAVAAVQTSRTAPAAAVERSQLVSRIHTAEAQQDRLRDRVAALSTQNSTLRRAAIGSDAAARSVEQRIGTLEPTVGTAAVTGPGLRITVDDARDATASNRDRVLDVDLQILVNGLWQAGAEAVAVNGHRLSALTAIRGAGEAITVDYRSLTGPYEVAAIGDPRTLAARLTETRGGTWWEDLAANRGLRYDTTAAAHLDLPADPGVVLRYARKGPS